jgi:hypothetical protein
MSELTGEIDPHANFRDLCMLYGDFNRPVFLEEILRFLSSWIASRGEIEAIRDALRKSEKRIKERQRAKRGRPHAWDNEGWIQKAMTAAFRRRVLDWSWPRVTESMGLEPTRPNIRTIQRRELRFAELIFEAIPPSGAWENGQYGIELRPGILDHKPVQQWIRSKTGLPFDDRPEECKKMVLALAPLGSKASTNSWLAKMRALDRTKKK